MSFGIGQKKVVCFAETFPSYPYLNVARQTGAAYGRVLKIADSFDCCDNYVTAAYLDLLPHYGKTLVTEVRDAWLREQQRRKLVLLDAGAA